MSQMNREQRSVLSRLAYVPFSMSAMTHGPSLLSFAGFSRHQPESLPK